jgi:protein-S-isoprenylcysteine O-methyltransferase Ste14
VDLAVAAATVAAVVDSAAAVAGASPAGNHLYNLTKGDGFRLSPFSFMAMPPTNSGVRIFPPLIHAGAIALGFLLQWIAPIRMSGMLLPGCLFLAIAVGLIAWTVVLMSQAGTTPNPTRPTTALILDGPFRRTRNPIYLAWQLIVIGVGLAAHAPWVILMALPAARATRRLVIDKEERYLETKFGAEYLEYKSQVRRWI